MTLRRRLLLALVGAFLALTLTTVVFPARMSESSVRLIPNASPPILPPFLGIPGFNGQAPTPYPTALG